MVGPFGGLNNTENSYIILANQAQDLLNVDLTEGAKSVKKRSGYGTAFTLSNATSPVHGIYTFYDSNGASVDLYFNDRNMNVSVAGGTPSVFFSTGANGATYQCVDSAGQAYCANTSRTSITKVNSSTYTLLTGFTSTGTMVTVTEERLVQAGFSDNPNMVWLSKANDFSTWTVGGNATDPIQFTITSPGSSVKHIVYAHGRVYWFKDSSFGYILEGNTQSDWRVVNIQSDLGSLYNTSIYRDEILYFQGNDGHFYAYDGSNLVKLSKDIQGTIDVTQGRTSNSWTQTTSSDWNASSITPQGYLSTSLVPGSVVLSTSIALSPFVDTNSSDFGAASVINISTTSINGSISLSTFTTVPSPTFVENTTGAGSGANSVNIAQSFKNVSTYTAVASVVLSVASKGGSGCSPTVRIKSNSSNTPGSDLATGTLPNATGSQTATISPPARLSPDTTYWAFIDSCGATDNLRFTVSLLNPYADGTFWSQTVGTDNAADAVFRINFDGSSEVYRSSGSIVSRVFDTGFTTSTWIWEWANFYSSGSIPSSGTVTYQTQTSSTSSGPWTTIAVVSTGSAPTSTVQQYIRYVSSFSTTDITTSPVINDYVINMSSRIRPSGVLYSQVKNAPNLTAWDTFGTDQQTNNGTLAWFVRSSTGVFYASATSPSWTSITPGAVPSISTNPYFQAASSFSVTSISQNPIMNSFTFNWFEGAASDKTYAIYHDNANWWSVASGTGATTNNKILKFNLINPGWYIYSIGANGMLVRSQSLYFGSPTAGKIHKYGSTEDDDGSSIEAYWKSKDFFGSSPFLDKDYSRLSSIHPAVVNSTMTITYTIDGSSSTSYSVNLGSSTSSFIQKNVNLPQGKTGKTINVKFGNNAANQPWEVFGAQADYTSKPWVPK